MFGLDYNVAIGKLESDYSDSMKSCRVQNALLQVLVVAK